MTNLCICGSEKVASKCCLPVLQGKKQASTAEQLMRSRYFAYAISDADYLMSSWHPQTRPGSLSLSASPKWMNLRICQTEAGREGDTEGKVEFIASYEQDGVAGQLHENSEFVFEKGEWLYVGSVEDKLKKTGRNEPCPCGSGKKFKKCCMNKG